MLEKIITLRLTLPDAPVAPSENENKISPPSDFQCRPAEGLNQASLSFGDYSDLPDVICVTDPVAAVALVQVLRVLLDAAKAQPAV